MESFLNPSEYIERIRSDRKLYKHIMILIMLICIIIIGTILTVKDNSPISQFIMIGLIILSIINIFILILENSNEMINLPKGFFDYHSVIINF